MNVKKIKTIIFILSLVLLIILFLLIYNYTKIHRNNNVFLNNTEDTSSDNINLSDNNEVITEYDPWNEDEPINQSNLELIKKTDAHSYFISKQCIEKYYESINVAYGLIDIDAKNLLGINQSNFTNFYVNIENSSICIDEIYEEMIRPTQLLYIVKYRMPNSGNGTNSSLLLIRMDLQNVNFSIYPYQYLRQKNLINLNENDIIEVGNIDPIEDNNYNRYKIGQISVEAPAIMSELLKRLQFDIKFDLNHLYNSLDEEYKKLKFENNPNKFLQYVNENKDIILNDEITGYQLHNTDEYTQYYGLASSQNHYIFNTNKTNNLMDYTIMLDNYIVDLPQAQEAYEKSSTKAKAEYCLQKTINAINDGNYNIVYDKLSLTQKNQYSNYDEFANYLKRAFYVKNDYEIEDYMILNKENAYQFLIKITDSTKKEFSFRRYNIRIVLQENMDYIVNITQYKN